jgi:glycosyltransferase involved in cell wall biosynthesis
MRIAILGSRGIPNIYGGFERFAEKVGPMLVNRGHEVIVYCSAYHPLKDEWWKGVQRVLCSDPEDTIGTAGQFMYDLNCIRDARERKLDVIIQLGYTSSSVWSFLFPDEVSVITNMDGMEWQRSKYSRPVQLFLQKAEAWAGQYSSGLIADSKAIETYLLEKYELPVRYISYGADIPERADLELLEEWGLEADGYDLVVARMEPENQIEAIIRANKEDLPLLLVGNADDGFGKKMWHRYGGEKIRFIGGVYDKRKLAALRAGSRYYFHGHSVGGTNPSLLEAMAAGCRIIAHDNVYNRDVLEDNALYFQRETDLMGLDPETHDWDNSVRNNLEKIKAHFNWDRVVDALEDYMKEIHVQG